MFYLFIIFSFLFGLIIGSFINCLVYRLHTKQPFITERSHCPKCRKQIIWYDNLPIISYLLLRGHCRHCRQTISLQYPLVEFACGLIFVLISLKIYFSFVLSTIAILYFVGYCFFAAVFLFIFIYDLRYYLIPDVVTLPAIFLALIFNLLIYFSAPTAQGFWSFFSGYFLGGLVGGGFFLAQFILSKGKWIGGGDIRLGFLIGFLLGWPHTLVCLFLAYISGAAVGIFLIISKKKSMQSAIPFGTFLTPSALITLLCGQWILTKYLSLTLY